MTSARDTIERSHIGKLMALVGASRYGIKDELRNCLSILLFESMDFLQPIKQPLANLHKTLFCFDPVELHSGALLNSDKDMHAFANIWLLDAQ